MKFLDRDQAFAVFKPLLQKAGLGVVFGRRRIGKSKFLEELCNRHQGIHLTAIEGSVFSQTEQLWKDLGGDRPAPTQWLDFFPLLTHYIKERKLKLLVLDEFPYLVKSDPNLPSILQKWIDTDFSKLSLTLIISGSSSRMMHSQFLEGTAPLYGRAKVVYRMPYLGYRYFLEFFDSKPNLESFKTFSLLGGVPRYWHLAKLGSKKASATSVAQDLFMSDSAILTEEPLRLLSDEGLTGQQPRDILDLIGKGCHKPSEIAARMNQTQGSLTKPLNQLIDAGLVSRSIPYGESSRDTKRALYLIEDPALLFCFSVASQKKRNWHTFNPIEQSTILGLHASKIFESTVRQHYGGSRYWSSTAELDCIAPLSDGRTLVAEVKFSRLSKKQNQDLVKKLEAKYLNTPLATKIKKPEFQVIDESWLKVLAKVKN